VLLALAVDERVGAVREHHLGEGVVEVEEAVLLVRPGLTSSV
jgi:hypothetical protein